MDSAGTAQAITAPPALTVGPNYEGAFIVFGTGKLLEPTDLKPTSGVFPANSMYGIWDKTPATDLATALARTNLMGQRILATENNSAYASGSTENGAIEFSLMCAYVPNYTATTRTNTISGTTNPLATGPTATRRPTSVAGTSTCPVARRPGSVRSIDPRLVGSFAIFVNALPSADACEGGGSEAQYALETLTGGRSNFGGFDRDANGKIQGANGSLLGDQSTFSNAGVGLGCAAEVLFEPARDHRWLRADDDHEDRGNGRQFRWCRRAATVRGSRRSASQSFTLGLIGSQRLPGGCIGRVQWRELVTH